MCKNDYREWRKLVDIIWCRHDRSSVNIVKGNIQSLMNLIPVKATEALPVESHIKISILKSRRLPGFSKRTGHIINKIRHYKHGSRWSYNESIDFFLKPIANNNPESVSERISYLLSNRSTTVNTVKNRLTVTISMVSEAAIKKARNVKADRQISESVKVIDTSENEATVWRTREKTPLERLLELEDQIITQEKVIVSLTIENEYLGNILKQIANLSNEVYNSIRSEKTSTTHQLEPLCDELT